MKPTYLQIWQRNGQGFFSMQTSFLQYRIWPHHQSLRTALVTPFEMAGLDLLEERFGVIEFCHISQTHNNDSVRPTKRDGTPWVAYSYDMPDYGCVECLIVSIMTSIIELSPNYPSHPYHNDRKSYSIPESNMMK